MSFRIDDILRTKETTTNTESLLKKSSNQSANQESVKIDTIAGSFPITRTSLDPWSVLYANELMVNSVLGNSQRDSFHKTTPASFDDYTSKLYSNLYCDRVYMPPYGLMEPTTHFDKGLSSSYSSLYSRNRPATTPWGFYPPAMSSMLFPPMMYSHYSKRKGGQVRFTSLQTDALEKRFKSHKYLSPEDRRVLADSLKLSDRQVKTWFQNRRAKWRRCNDITDKPDRLESSESDSDSTLEVGEKVIVKI